MKHLLAVTLLLTSLSVQALTRADITRLPGFMPATGWTNTCRDPDKSLAQKSTSTFFSCAAFVIKDTAYLVFTEINSVEVLEIYRFDNTTKAFNLVPSEDAIYGAGI